MTTPAEPQTAPAPGNATPTAPPPPAAGQGGGVSGASPDFEAMKAKLAAAEKQAADSDKKLAATLAKIESPEFIKDRLSQVLGLDKEKDPKAEFSALQGKYAKAESTARNALLKAAASDIFAEEDAKPKARSRLVGMLDFSGVNVDLDAGKVDADAIRAQVQALKSDLPELFTIPPTGDAARSQPLPPSATPSVRQPPHLQAVPEMTQDQVWNAYDTRGGRDAVQAYLAQRKAQRTA